MATTLELKIRDRSDSVRIPIRLVVEWLKLSEEEAKESLYNFFRPFEDGNAKIHDKVFLETTINWVPIDEQSGRAKGLPLAEQVRWIRLAQKVNDIDEKEDGELILSNKDIELIWNRWKDNAFKIVSLQPNVIEFLMKFQKVTNRWFPEFESGKDEEEVSPPEVDDDVTIGADEN